MAASSSSFTKKCHISTHNNNLVVDDKNIFQLNNKRNVPSAVSTYVLNNKLVSDRIPRNNRIPNICNICLENVQSLMKHPLKRQRSHEEREDESLIGGQEANNELCGKNNN